MVTVTLALVGFIFVCVAMPQIVRGRPPFYLAVLLVMLILLLNALERLFVEWPRTINVMVVLESFSVFAAFVALILATGGLSLREFTGDMADAFAAMRRGKAEERTVIVPAPTAAYPNAAHPAAPPPGLVGPSAEPAAHAGTYAPAVYPATHAPTVPLGTAGDPAGDHTDHHGEHQGDHHDHADPAGARVASVVPPQQPAHQPVVPRPPDAGAIPLAGGEGERAGG